MADVRVVVMDGQGAVAVWFDVEASCTIADDDIGKPCAITGNNEVSDGADGETFLGKILALSPNGATTADEALVQVGGLVTGLAYAGTTPVVGHGVQMQAAHVVDKGTTLIHRGTCVNVDTTATTCDVYL